MKTSPLYAYQKRVNEFTDGKERVGIFAFYGSGKSYLSLKWLESLHLRHKHVFPCLVLAPKSLVNQWGSEIEKHTRLKYSLVEGDAEQRVSALRREAAHIYVVNYDAVRSEPVQKEFMTGRRFRSIVADESTYLKEARTKRFKHLRRFAKKIPFRVILSGKPILEKLEDIWSQLMFLDDGETLGSSFWKFRYTYFAPGPPWRPYEWALKPGAEQTIAAQLNKKCIRIKREDVITELPPKIYNTVHLKMPSPLKKMYDKLRRDFRVELPDGEVYDTIWAMVKANKLHQLCQGFMYKDNEIKEFDDTKTCWLEENLPLMLENGPVLLWTCFRAVVDRVAELLTKVEIPFQCYSGEQSSKERAEAIRQFQEGEVDILLLTEQAGSYGLNLQRANQAVFVDTDYKAALRENAESRCHRLGSEVHENITFYDLVMEKSIDEVVLRAIQKKLDLTELVLQHIRGA